MGSNRVGEGPSSGKSSSSSRKGKKNSPEKAKQPQRGLGVAQLEKLRIQNQLMAGYNLPSPHPHFHDTLMEEDASRSLFSSSSILSVQPNSRIGYEDNLSSYNNYGFGEHQYCPSTRFSQFYAIGQETLPLMEDSMQNSYYTTSFSHRSNSEDTEEMDLELKLSL
ncbi:hypothetical protein HPP92_019983 [Vanilla planifolia]|uniref:Uncharacterized protein n=1 Tax=Vanilla planifolia TaxID=51239 RepID=A0A835UI21_VANPL|nr:hypothetical protein HPP92_019983 [Vanilla planifolia]